jgi:hypothetical protein
VATLYRGGGGGDTATERRGYREAEAGDARLRSKNARVQRVNQRRCQTRAFWKLMPDAINLDIDHRLRRSRIAHFPLLIVLMLVIVIERSAQISANRSGERARPGRWGKRPAFPNLGKGKRVSAGHRNQRPRWACSPE